MPWADRGAYRWSRNTPKGSPLHPAEGLRAVGLEQTLQVEALSPMVKKPIIPFEIVATASACLSVAFLLKGVCLGCFVDFT